MGKKVGILIGICLLLISVLFVYQHTQAANIYMEYYLPDPIGDLYSEENPPDLETVSSWISNPPPNHTGWSASIFEYRAESHIVDGEETHWWERKYNTRDGFEDVTYTVDRLKNEIIDEHGQEFYDKLEAGGFYFNVKSGQSVKDYQKYAYSSKTEETFINPKVGDRYYLYYENMITVYLDYFDTGNEPKLTVLPPSQTIEVGETAQYQAIYRENGVETDVTEQADWSSVDTTIGESLGNGKFKGKKIGSTDIQATYEELTGKAVLNVGVEEPEPEPLPPNQPPVAIIDG
ncbi:Ig-like domain-containing protein, partial [Butyricicoccus sp. 1XD8-22]